MALHLEADCPVVAEHDAPDDFVQLHCSLREHLRIQVPDVKFILAFVRLAVEVHEIAGDGVDQLLILHCEGEALVDGPLQEVLLVAHKAIEEGQLQVLCEVLVSKGYEVLPALQF
jgi:hypothetical protein